jgi:hypothetical protein
VLWWAESGAGDSLSCSAVQEITSTYSQGKAARGESR